MLNYSFNWLLCTVAKNLTVMWIIIHRKKNPQPAFLMLCRQSLFCLFLRLMMFFGCFSVTRVIFYLSFTGTELSHVRLHDSCTHPPCLSLVASARGHAIFIVTSQHRLLCFLCQGIFLLSRTSFAWLCNILTGGGAWSCLMEVLLSSHMFLMTWGPLRVDVEGNS